MSHDDYALVSHKSFTLRYLCMLRAHEYNHGCSVELARISVMTIACQISTSLDIASWLV